MNGTAPDEVYWLPVLLLPLYLLWRIWHRPALVVVPLFLSRPASMTKDLVEKKQGGDFRFTRQFYFPPVPVFVKIYRSGQFRFFACLFGSGFGCGFFGIKDL